MKTKERLELLLEWINSRSEREWSSAEILRRLRKFVDSFDGEPVAAGEVNMHPEQWQIQVTARDAEGKVLTPTDNAGLQLAGLAMRLDSLLAGKLRMNLPSLSFHVQIDRNGLNELAVSGDLPDVVLYLTTRVVVDEIVELGRCQAPVPNPPGVPKDGDYTERCRKVYVVGKRGATCSDRCRQRTKDAKFKAFEKRLQRRRR